MLSVSCILGEVNHPFSRKTKTGPGLSRNVRLNNQESLTWTAEGSNRPLANRTCLALDTLCKNTRVRA